MPQRTVGDVLNLSVELHRAGRLGEAESLYRQILARVPDHADAIHLLGVACQQQGRGDEALRLLRRAAALNPDVAMFQANLARALNDQGGPAAAVPVFERALVLAPGAPDVLLDYGNALHAQGRPADAINAYRRAIRLAPNLRGAHERLGAVLLEAGACVEAVEELALANRIEPRPATCANLGTALQALARLDEAIEAFGQYAALAPADHAAHRALGLAHWQKGDGPSAIEAYRKAVELDPQDAEAFSHLGNLLGQSYELEASADASRRAADLDPRRADALVNLGVMLLRQARIPEAVDAARRGAAAAPTVAAAHSNLLLALNYDDAGAPEDIFAEHVAFGDRFGAPAGWSPAPPHENDRSPDRRLRVGYVSPDLREHPVARFMEPILAHHDPAQVEVFCYVMDPHPDAVTQRLKQCRVVWRPIERLDDDRAAGLIRADGVDVLVDLAGHTAGNRLTMFTRRPAPVQVTYLGYPNTTGLRAIDYRITDAAADPPGEADALNVERLYRLPETAWCYGPPAEAPDVNELPALAAGRVTLGSFNAAAKLSSSTIELWSTLLDQISGSRLLLKAPSFHDRPTRQRVATAFVARGVGEDRLILRPSVPGVAVHLGTYHEVDLALDPWPYNGTTTTCEALWMGVPVVTLAGQTHASRVGRSLLATVGLPELAATGAREDFLRIATALASDLSRLKTLRAGLRDRMKQSPLMDAPRFVRELENAYRTMWKEWCHS
jgi:predicted O-linked N-acetylglucosamine transferase (SPINDLY family)